MQSKPIREIRITHRPSGALIAQGPVGWGITPFEGNYYISRRYLKMPFKPNFIPGLCIYKFLYVWMDLELPDGTRERSLGWLYWLPNPLLPFIWYRVAVPANHPNVRVERLGVPSLSSSPSTELKDFGQKPNGNAIPPQTKERLIR